MFYHFWTTLLVYHDGSMQQRCSRLFVHQAINSLFQHAWSSLSTTCTVQASQLNHACSSWPAHQPCMFRQACQQHALFKLASSTMFKLASSSTMHVQTSRPVNNTVQASQLNHVQAGQLNGHLQAGQLNGHLQAGQLINHACMFRQAC